MDLHTLVRSVEDYVRQRLARYIDELSTLCAFETFTFHKAGIDQATEWLAARLQALGMEVAIVERQEWGNDLLGTLHGQGDRDDIVVLLAHSDTVYPIGTAAARPLRREGNRLYAPGVCDMKGCILAALYALEALQALNYRPFGELRFLCVSDEEINVRHCDDLMEQVLHDAHRAFVLEAARANGAIVSARKGNAGYTLRAYGRAAHAGVEPEKGRNAIVELAHQVLQFAGLSGWRAGLTVTPGLINGGIATNVIPDYAEARFDLRFLHLEDKEATEERWLGLLQQQRVPGVRLELEEDPHLKHPLVCTPAAHRLAEQAQAIAAMLGFSLEHVLTGGASDASYAALYSVPTLDGLGPIGGNDHSPDEYLLLDSVAPRAALLAGLIASPLPVEAEAEEATVIHHTH
ncbi:M20 family metallopeptidase [Thermogemmatispora carboxidivorans]|uniref:M20 family metallopeptidase n=1 Tax=Thermogemmatispora carboxidivorans TaxID=1382306 RepID=UPI00069B6443|nr:M20 family metallopeptidase [Thermogemmatispora carboxidivorans]